MNETDNITELSNKVFIAELQRRANQSPEFLKQAQATLVKKETVVASPSDTAETSGDDAVGTRHALSEDELVENKSTDIPTSDQNSSFLDKLSQRFNKKADYYTRPEGVNFTEVKAALEVQPVLMQSLMQMENTGGAPDVLREEDEAFVFADFSKESPSGRRKLKFQEAVEMAEKMGVAILKENDYRLLQELGEFDRNTFSYLASDDVINTGFAHRGFRNDYGSHVDLVDSKNGYQDRGWRALLRVPKS